MGYIKTKYLNENKEIFIEIRNKQVKAKIIKTPFIKSLI